MKQPQRLLYTGYCDPPPPRHGPLNQGHSTSCEVVLQSRLQIQADGDWLSSQQSLLLLQDLQMIGVTILLVTILLEAFTSITKAGQQEESSSSVGKWHQIAFFFFLSSFLNFLHPDCNIPLPPLLPHLCAPPHPFLLLF